MNNLSCEVFPSLVKLMKLMCSLFMFRPDELRSHAAPSVVATQQIALLNLLDAS